jgi:curved DNA-binding protein CbpA
MQHPGPGPGRDDPYRVLGLDTGASRQDIARAYRRAVHGAHPDTQPDDPQAIMRFHALTDAYDLLSDPDRRADYDRQHPAEPPDTIERWPGPPPQAPVPGGQPIWAGPVASSRPAARLPVMTGAARRRRTSKTRQSFSAGGLAAGGAGRDKHTVG